MRPGPDRQGRALREPVAVATDVLAPASVAFRGERLCHDIVEKCAVVAHKQQRARVFLQRLLEQFERFHVEVVRRLIEHEQVRGLREQAREQQPVALAAREHAHRGAGASGREQEVLQIRGHVPATIARPDPVGTRADGIRDRAIGIELRAQLVEVGDAKLRAGAHGAGVGRQFTEHQPQQRCLAGTVRADDPDAIATQDAQRQVPHDWPRPEADAHVVEFDDEPAGAIARVEREAHVSGALAAFGALDAQPLEPAHTPFVACAARLDAAPDPRFLLLPELVEATVGDGLGRELLRLCALVRREVSRVGAQHAAIELDDARRDAIEEASIVGHDDERRGAGRERFQLLDAGDVEVVGRFIEQQQLGLECKRQRECSACARHPRDCPTPARPRGRSGRAVR